MKAPAFTVFLALVAAGCHSVSVPNEQVVVTTPTGRKEVLKSRHTIKEIEAGSAAVRPSTNPLDIPHPVFPGKKELEELKQHVRGEDEIWYFQGLDSGWAVARDGRVVWVLVTNHEY